MSRCARCRASLPDASTWCGQCFTPVEPDPVLHPRSVVGVVRVVPRYSRWRKTETTFGPAGRVLWTVLVVLVAVLTVVSANPFALIAWVVIGAPLVLRSVWARQRIT